MDLHDFWEIGREIIKLCTGVQKAKGRIAAFSVLAAANSFGCQFAEQARSRGERLALHSW